MSCKVERPVADVELRFHPHRRPGLTFDRRFLIYDKQDTCKGKEAGMSTDLREMALRLKVIEILKRYCWVRHQLKVIQLWKKLFIHPN